MSLYRNLGAISFETQTPQYEVFSCSLYATSLILQPQSNDGVHKIVTEQLSRLVSVYKVVLKQQKIIELYTQKQKPQSLLVHQATRVQLPEKVNIHLLCRIFKEVLASIAYLKKMFWTGMTSESFTRNQREQSSSHQQWNNSASHYCLSLSKEMIFEIDGELRFIYLPFTMMSAKCPVLLESHDINQIVDQKVLDFLHEFKDEANVSHRLLFKKISKCTSLEEVSEETQYFLSIYHAKEIIQSSQPREYVQPKNVEQIQQDTSGSAFYNTSPLNSTFSNLSTSQPYQQSCVSFGNRNSDYKSFQLQPNRNDTHTVLGTAKSPVRRKYNLFNKQKSARNLAFSSHTCRNSQFDNNFSLNHGSTQNNFRLSSHAVKPEFCTQRGGCQGNKIGKNLSTSFFSRSGAIGSKTHQLKRTTQYKLNCSQRDPSRCQKKSNTMVNSKTNSSYLKKVGNSKPSQRPKSTRNQQNCMQYLQKPPIHPSSSIINESSMSKDLSNSIDILNESQIQTNQGTSVSTQQISWMKEIVNKSLQKWREKATLKTPKLFEKINTSSPNSQLNQNKSNQMEGSTRLQSQSKIAQLNSASALDFSESSELKPSSKQSSKVGAAGSRKSKVDSNEKIVKNYPPPKGQKLSISDLSNIEDYVSQIQGSGCSPSELRENHTKQKPILNCSDLMSSSVQKCNKHSNGTKQNREPTIDVENTITKNKRNQKDANIGQQAKSESKENSFQEIQLQKISNKLIQTADKAKKNDAGHRIDKKHKTSIGELAELTALRLQNERNKHLQAINPNVQKKEAVECLKPCHFNSDESETERVQYRKKSGSKQHIGPKYSGRWVADFVQAQVKQIQLQRELLDFLGIAVVQTNGHLRSFDSICWQLPLFFLYKKFYEQRLLLRKKTQELTEFKNIKSILVQKVGKNEDQLQKSLENKLVTTFKEAFSEMTQNIGKENQQIETSLAKLLKTAKKKIKKTYSNQKQREYIEKVLNLDYTTEYDASLVGFINTYLASLFQAILEYPQLMIHVIEILEGLIAWRCLQKKQAKQSQSMDIEFLQRREQFSALLKSKNVSDLTMEEGPEKDRLLESAKRYYEYLLNSQSIRAMVTVNQGRK